MNDIPEWAWKRLAEIIGYDINKLEWRDWQGFPELAAYIAKHEEAPVDPDLIEARAIAARANENAGYLALAKSMRAGERDNHIEVKMALAAIKRGRELERTTTPTEPAWIEHDGSATCPVPDGVDCEVKLRGGDTERDNTPQDWLWHKVDGAPSFDITHYRVWPAQ